MAEPGFQIVFDGQLVEGADPAQVKANIAKLFKMEVAKVEPLFSGRPTVVKRGLDDASAQKYRIAFERAGAVATIVDPNEMRRPAPLRRLSRRRRRSHRQPMHRTGRTKARVVWRSQRQAVRRHP